MKLFLSFLFLILIAGCGDVVQPVNPVTPTPVEPIDPPTPDPVKRVQIGTPALAGMNYSWFCPNDAVLSDKTVAQPFVQVFKTTICTVTVTSKCGQATSNVTIRAYEVDENGQLVEIK